MAVNFECREALAAYLNNPSIKGIRSTRKREQARTHIDFVKEGTNCG